jgi:uncharacterized protein
MCLPNWGSIAMSIDPELYAKRQTLMDIIAGLGRVAVAFSGGVDSSYLLSACVDVLGAANVVAVTVDSPLLPRAELETARQVARQLGARHLVVPMDELEMDDVRANPPDRCYYCKRARFQALIALTRSTGDVVLHGENADDHLDYRPGSRAARELAVRAPLAEAGLGKAEIRVLSRARGLPTWDHPPAACLASRVPYGTALTREALGRIEQAEEALQGLFPGMQLRVRDHHPLARIEAPADALTQFIGSLRGEILARLRAAGFRYVTLDLDGYRMGSLNEELTDRSTDQPS